MTAESVTAKERGPNRGSRGAQAPFAGGAVAPVSPRTVRGDVTGPMDQALGPRFGTLSGPPVGSSLGPWTGRAHDNR